MKCPYCQYYYESYESICCDIQPPDKWIHKFTCGMVRKKAQKKLNKTVTRRIEWDRHFI